MRSKNEILADAKKRIENMEHFERNGMLKPYQQTDLALFKDLVALIEQPQWIPCSERLPEEKINPITKCYYAYPVIVDFGDGVIDIRFYHFGRRHWLHVGLEMDKYVTYWMDIHSLPTPYKGE